MSMRITENYKIIRSLFSKRKTLHSAGTINHHIGINFNSAKDVLKDLTKKGYLIEYNLNGKNFYARNRKSN